MHLGRNLTNGAMGGLVCGAGIGLFESVFHAATRGAPDLWAPVYGLVLYALLGLPFGIGGGIGATVLEAVLRKTKWKVEPFMPWVLGGMAATVPLLGFALYYLANIHLYLEQGVPLTGLVGIAAILGVLCGLLGIVPCRTVRIGALNRMLHPNMLSMTLPTSAGKLCST